ncbi:MAG TPA: MBL fold metallo-hydrolase, partial [Candidatus Pacearchaeota archaeon]|nr:MBL fold metallo-hydrolase [Candidatus Pacearchaeota archaeon]
MTIKVTFLGTAASIPTVNRNHTSIHLNYQGENILIDCGEGTQRQFRKAGLNPCKITRILITHWHGDHVLGVPGLLQTLALTGYRKTLHIYGPKGTKQFLKKIS